jgi:hypothetical protein
MPNKVLKKTGGSKANDFIRNNFGKAWPVFVHAYTEYTIDCRKSFDGDLDLMLVLAVIGDRTLNKQNTRPDLTHQELMADPRAHVLPLDINTASISAYSGIPRETVRRKIVTLQEKGWIARDAEGMLLATEHAARDLAAMMDIGIRYMSSMFQLFEHLLQEEDPATPAPTAT